MKYADSIRSSCQTLPIEHLIGNDQTGQISPSCGKEY